MVSGGWKVKAAKRSGHGEPRRVVMSGILATIRRYCSHVF